MVITEKTYLPTEEELTVQELDITYPVFHAAANHLGKYCEWFANEFTLCKDELRDPRKCINEGKKLTACGIEFFQKVKKNCAQEFTQYYNCIDKSSGEQSFIPCRQTQAIFDKCMEDKMNIERPGFGYFCQIKVHDSPRPEPKPKKIVWEDTPDPIPQKPYPPGPKFGHDSNAFK